jgi:hypothetical protein
MGDKINLGNVGQLVSLGSHNVVTDNRLNQTDAEPTLPGINMLELATQLDELIRRLKDTANDREQYAVLAEVIRAASAAEENNPENVLKHLRRAGPLALDVANSIGAPLAVVVLEKVLGLS